MHTFTINFHLLRLVEQIMEGMARNNPAEVDRLTSHAIKEIMDQHGLDAVHAEMALVTTINMFQNKK